MYELLHSTGASAPTLLTIAVGRSDPSGTVRTCVAKNAAQSQTKYPITGSWARIPALPYRAEFRVRTVLGSIGEELALAICLSGWAKPAVSEVGLGSMSSRVAPMRVKILNQPGSLTESCSFLCGFRNWFQILGCPQELRATAPRSWACTQWASSP